MTDHTEVRVVQQLLTTDTARKVALEIGGHEYHAAVFQRADCDWQLHLLPQDRGAPAARVTVSELPGNDTPLNAAELQEMLLALANSRAAVLAQPASGEDA